MKNSILFVSICILTVVCSLVAPWWVIAPISFTVAYLAKMKSSAGFGVPFLSVLITWLIAIYLNDNGVVAELMGKLLLLPNWSTPFLSACLGGLVAGCFGLSGALFSYRKKTWVNG
jgi:hypothetical protein